ncbi:hypothetical protein [Saccharibacillus qingshengii]|uniref:hypothetical protein n=1 Tax=Saccharibacillus qingshengii TaxID=1763540 RepID=UPI00155537A0|nr:hypothetical protein [Saccharibacillus qingshengii]
MNKQNSKRPLLRLGAAVAAAVLLLGGCSQQGERMRNETVTSQASPSVQSAAPARSAEASAAKQGISEPSAPDRRETLRSIEKNRIRWINAEVVVTAGVSKYYDQAEVITADFESLRIEAPSLPQAIDFPETPETVESVTVSPDRSYAAIEAGYHESTKLFIVDLASGQLRNLNEELEQEGYGFVEVIHGAAWMPANSVNHGGHILAFGYGLIGEMKTGMYNLDNARLFEAAIPDKNTVVNASSFQWSADGRMFDFVGETYKGAQESFRVFRYAADTGETIEIGPISRAELVNRNEKTRGPTIFVD